MIWLVGELTSVKWHYSALSVNWLSWRIMKLVKAPSVNHHPTTKYPKNNTILAAFCFRNFCYVFTQMSSFKTWFVLGILKLQRGIEVDILDFLVKHWCRYLGFFGLETTLTNFSKKIGQICSPIFRDLYFKIFETCNVSKIDISCIELGYSA